MAEHGHHRISVKRETRPAGRADLPDGVGSCWLHDGIEVGDQIDVAAPRDTSLLDEGSPRPVLLLAGGVGLTPLLSMLLLLAGTGRDVWFVHACGNGTAHAMEDEVRALAAGEEDRVRTHFA